MRARTRTVAVSAALTVALLATGCSRDSDVPSAGNPVTSVTPSTAPSAPAAPASPASTEDVDQESAATEGAYTTPQGAQCEVTDPEVLEQYGPERAGRGLCAAMAFAAAAMDPAVVIGRDAEGAPIEGDDTLGPVSNFLDLDVFEKAKADDSIRDSLTMGNSALYDYEVVTAEPPIVDLDSVSLSTQGGPIRLQVTNMAYVAMTYREANDEGVMTTDDTVVRRSWRLLLTENPENGEWRISDFEGEPLSASGQTEFDVTFPERLQPSD